MDTSHLNIHDLFPREFKKMLKIAKFKKVRKSSFICAFLSRSEPKVTGVYSGLRLILHPRFGGNVFNGLCEKPTRYKKKTFAKCCVHRWNVGVQSQTLWRNEHPESHQVVLWLWRDAQRKIYFNLWILKIDSFSLLRQQTVEVTSVVGCSCSGILTAKWSWRENVLLLQRGKVKHKR